MKYASVAFVVLFFATPTSASFVTGNDLLRFCTEDKNSALYAVNQGQCLGYIQAVADAEEFFMQYSEVPKHLCLENGVTVGQMQDVVVNFLRKSPELRHHSAQTVASIALSVAFPCSYRK